MIRLKLPTGWMVLTQGSYELGRGSQCRIVLDGAKVSRLHAKINVDVETARVYDMGSANGVFVNGRRVSHAGQQLGDGDALVIGEFELLVSYTDEPDEERFPSMRPTLVEALPMAPSKGSAPPVAVATTKAGALDLLGSVAERAIAAGDARRAEGILSGRLLEVLEGVRAGRGADTALCDEAFRLAMLLARALSTPIWVDYAFELLAERRILPNAAQGEDLERTLAGVSGFDPRKVEAYEKALGSLPSTLEKLRMLQRLERVRSRR